MQHSFNVCLFAIVLGLAFASREQLECDYQPSSWSDCVDGSQIRNLTCLCVDSRGRSSDADLSSCSDAPLPELTQDCEEEMPPVCSWKWTRWSRCSRPCDGGNTTRKQVCVCETTDDDGEVDAAVMDASYCDIDQLYGNETAECNTFSCENIPAFNKLYWIMKADEGHWPMPDGVFNCSLGYDVNVTSPMGKHYSTILRDNRISGKPHSEWYYLAKEWIAAELNLANGVEFDQSTLDLIDSVGKLLEKCTGWTGKDLYGIYIAKEKLGRINNNIGSLEHVDDQLAVIYGGSEGTEEQEDAGPFMLMIIIPAVAVVVVILVALVTVYYVRRQRNKVVEQSTFESDDEAEKQQQPPLEDLDSKKGLTVV